MSRLLKCSSAVRSGVAHQNWNQSTNSVYLQNYTGEPVRAVSRYDVYSRGSLPVIYREQNSMIVVQSGGSGQLDELIGGGVVWAKLPPKAREEEMGGRKRKSKEEEMSEKKNIDFLYSFDEDAQEQFRSLVSTTKFSNKFLRYLEDNVETKVALHKSNALVRMKVFPENKTLKGKQQFSKTVLQAINAMKLLHNDVIIKVVYSEPEPHHLRVRLRVLLRGVPRVLATEPVHYNFLLQFYFSKSTKQIRLVELTDKTMRDDTQLSSFLTTAMAFLPGIGLATGLDSLSINADELDDEEICKAIFSKC